MKCAPSGFILSVVRPANAVDESNEHNMMKWERIHTNIPRVHVMFYVWLRCAAVRLPTFFHPQDNRDIRVFQDRRCFSFSFHLCDFFLLFFLSFIFWYFETFYTVYRIQSIGVFLATKKIKLSYCRILLRFYKAVFVFQYGILNARQGYQYNKWASYCTELIIHLARLRTA